MEYFSSTVDGLTVCTWPLFWISSSWTAVYHNWQKAHKWSSSFSFCKPRTHTEDRLWFGSFLHVLSCIKHSWYRCMAQMFSVCRKFWMETSVNGPALFVTWLQKSITTHFWWFWSLYLFSRITQKVLFAVAWEISSTLNYETCEEEPAHLACVFVYIWRCKKLH